MQRARHSSVKMLLVATCSVAVLAGCQQPVALMDSTYNTYGLEDSRVPCDALPEGAKDKTVTVRYSKDSGKSLRETELRITPSFIFVCPGATITLETQGRSTGSDQPRTWSISPKPGNPTDWFSRQSAGIDEDIVVRVPMDGVPPGPYKYSVTIDQVGTLDPTWQIKR